MSPENRALYRLRNLFYRSSGFIERSYSRFERFVIFSRHPLLMLVIIGLIIRIALIPFSFNSDMRYWGYIVNIIDNDLGLYDTDGYYYAPVWGYVLGLSSFLGKMVGITDYGALIPQFVPYMSDSYTVFEYVMSIGFSLIVKIPLIIADVITGLLIHRFVKSITQNDGKAVMAFSLWFFCPLVLIESCVHGMPDNLSALFIILTVMLTYERHYFSAGVAFSFSMLVKIFPVCFLFLLAVWVFKKEGWDFIGLKKLGTAIAGTIVGFIVLDIPSIISGNIWEIMRFLTDRLGVTTTTVNEILPLSRIIIIAAVLLIVLFILWKLFGGRFIGVREKIKTMDAKARDKIAIRFTVFITMFFVLVIAVISVITVSRIGDATFMTYFESIAMKLMMIVALVSVALSLFIAYRFAFNGELNDEKLFTALMLTSSFLFIWMPLPQYPVAIIPMMVLYVILVDRRFFVPFLIFTICMSLYELAMGGITAMFSIASFTDLIDIGVITGFLDFYTNKSFFVEPNMIFIVLSGAIAYISMIYIPIKWLREHNWGRLE